MAISKGTTVAPGVTRKEFPWWWELYGTKEALIASGLVKAEWFVEPGLRHHKGIRRSKYQEVDGRWIRTTISSKGRCVVCFKKTTDETREEKSEIAEVKTAGLPREFEIFLSEFTRRTVATFKAGDIAFYEIREELVEIDEGFGCYDVIDQGVRWGYVIRLFGGEKLFVPAGTLSSKDGDLVHLKLLNPAPTRTEWKGNDPHLPRAS